MLEDIIKERRRKLNNIVKEGLNPYPSKVRRTVSVADALKNFNKLSRSKKQIFIAGRILGLRDQGNLIFADVKDGSGKIQGVIRKDSLIISGGRTSKKLKSSISGGSTSQILDFKFLKLNLDIGDFISIGGALFKTKTGEKSVEAKSAEIIAKSLRPLPTQWYGLKDVEERFRKRYLDVILNPEIKEKFAKRSEIIAFLRQKLDEEGFLEVETPMLQPIPGGAKARPFTTHHNALDVDFCLRIAPELYLKRLLVAGFEKVFEIGRNFRNEGIDRDHNPEFTMLELYWAYQDWEGLMKFVEKLLKKFIGGRWEKITFSEALKKYAKTEYAKAEDLDEIFKKEVRSKIIKPTFITHYPKSISPLAKSCPNNPELTERFQLIVNGTEIVNGFSELNDPVEQRKRMEEQEKMYRAGDQEASRLDEDFLEALEYGMPPASGLGIGIDRLAALITKSHNIKEVIIFPTLRPK